MKKSEFEKKVKKLKIDTINFQGKMPEYCKKLYSETDGKDLYGCYFDGEYYVIFFKDLERGIVMEIGNFKTEDEAYDELYIHLKEWTKR